MTTRAPPERPIHEHYVSRLTIDLDGKHGSLGVEAVRAWHNLLDVADAATVSVSSSWRGLHLVGYFEERLAFHEEVAIRRSLGDDPRRVDMDIERWKQGLYTNVLFSRKDRRDQQKVRDFADVYDALEFIETDQGRDDYQRVKRMAVDGHRAAPDLAPKAEGL